MLAKSVNRRGVEKERGKREIRRWLAAAFNHFIE